MERTRHRWRVVLIAGLPFVALICLYLYGPIRQHQILPDYHHFADQRTLWGVPNFWNVASNLGFLLAALWGLPAARTMDAFIERWERNAYGILLGAVALTAFGSAYYHAWPDDATLFWDRLPMALCFTALLATMIGERISPVMGRILLLPLLAVGAGSVLYWRLSDDLRLYGLVQFYTVLALLLLLMLFPARYTGTAGMFAMLALYVLALALDRLDRQVVAITATGGHPWKHVAAAAGMLAYVITIAHRRPLAGPCGESVLKAAGWEQKK